MLSEESIEAFIHDLKVKSSYLVILKYDKINNWREYGKGVIERGLKANFRYLRVYEMKKKKTECKQK